MYLLNAIVNLLTKLKIGRGQEERGRKERGGEERKLGGERGEERGGQVLMIGCIPKV